MRKKNKKHADVAKLYPHLSTKKIVEMTGLSHQTVSGIARTEKLHKKSYYWTKKEDQYLVDNYEQYGWRYVADHLNRTKDGVIGRWRKIKKKS